MPAQRALLVTNTGSAILMLPPWVVQVQVVSSAWCEIPVLWRMLLTSHCQPLAPRVLGMLRWGFPDLLTLELVNEAIRKTIFWNNKGSWPVLLPSPKGKTNQQPCILNSYGSLIPIPVVLVQYGNYLRCQLADTLLWFKQDNTEQQWIFHTSQLVNPGKQGPSHRVPVVVPSGSTQSCHAHTAADTKVFFHEARGCTRLISQEDHLNQTWSTSEWICLKYSMSYEK